jgi:hypothetical protein
MCDSFYLARVVILSEVQRGSERSEERNEVEESARNRIVSRKTR